MTVPVLFLIAFMGVITAPGLIALHLEDRRKAQTKDAS